MISWLIAGFGCCFSAMSYAELSCRIPSAGSSYAYVYVALGIGICINTYKYAYRCTCTCMCMCKYEDTVIDRYTDK